MTFDGLFDNLINENLIFKHTANGKEILSSLLRAYEHYDRVDHKTEIGAEGFFFIDGGLVASRVEVRYDVAREAAAAVQTIKEMQEKFYCRYEEQQRLAHVLKFAVQSPFDYAKRQLHLENNILQRVDLSGRPDTGKTFGYARLPLLIY